MEAATLSAIASTFSAGAAWFAFGSTTHRAKKDWQRTTVLQSAVTILRPDISRACRAACVGPGDSAIRPVKRR